MLVGQHAERPMHKQAHLVLRTAKSNVEKPKEPVFMTSNGKKQNKEIKMTTRQNPELSTPKKNTL